MTLEAFERIVKLSLGSCLAICEAAFWGARPSTYTFIGAVLISSEVARKVKARTGGDKEDG